MNKRILVASAWPYANGSLHLGHVASLLGADIIARQARLAGDEVLFVSGSDCHGTPIAVEADKLGLQPQEIAEKYHKEFKKNLIDDLKFSYDYYTATTTSNHKEVVQDIFTKLYSKDVIYTKTEELPFCLACERFLPDRYIEGECPHCHFDSARGDQCDECSNLLDPDQLLKPRCKTCSNKPVWRPSEHFFLRLSAFTDQLLELAKNSHGWSTNAEKLTLSLLKEGLPDRAITRDTSWGVPIPIVGYEEKRIYVWFEAVCGYLSASKEWSQKQDADGSWKKFWEDDSVIHYYVHGKDNIPFHTIVWPAILLGYTGLHLPDRIISSEHLTLKKDQFSKSRSWAVLLKDFLQKFEAETLRYYLISNGPETADADFTWENYRTRTNTELIGTFGNYVHRVLSFSKTNFPDGVHFPTSLSKNQEGLLKKAEECFDTVQTLIEEGHLREALRQVIQLSADGNRYLNDVSPWKSIKQDSKKAELDLAVALHLVRCLAILVSPFLPTTAELISASLRSSPRATWRYLKPDFTVVVQVEPLYKKIEEQAIEEQISLLEAK